MGNFVYQNQGNNLQGTGFDTQLALPSTAWNNPQSNFNNKWTNNQTQNVKQDWSAFESLLPSQQNNDKVKKLNDNEMMDLLS